MSPASPSPSLTAPNEDSVIITRGLGRSFGEVRAVEGLDLTVRRGELFGLVGPDGAGKTTLMRMLASILLPTEGEARVAGYDVRSEPELIKEHLGYMSQRFGLYEDLTVEENIDFYAELYEVPLRQRAERIASLLDFSGLGPFTDRRAGALSGGMKQKLGLVCALVHRPALVLLDEPTSGVDPVSRRSFWGILYGLLKEGITVVVSTSYLDEAERFSRVALMHKGRLLITEEPQALRQALGLAMYEVWHTEPRAVLEALASSKEVLSANAYGDTVHVSLVSGSGPDLLKQLLDREGLTEGLKGLRPVMPSLEDVFIELVRRAG